MASNQYSVDLMLTGTGSAPWRLGNTYSGNPTLNNIIPRVRDWLARTTAEAVLFWDPELGMPDEEQVSKALSGGADVWHAGLRLGMSGLPRLMDYVQPTWMFNCDPSPDIEATSWRLSLRACLARTEVLCRMGFLHHDFHHRDAAGLEWGHRLITSGVIVRHAPGLLERSNHGSASRTTVLSGTTTSNANGIQRCSITVPALSFDDQLRFVHFRFGRKWAAWSLCRALMTRYATWPAAIRAWRRLQLSECPAESAPHQPVNLGARTSRENRNAPPQVTVLIPTVDRYPYLRILLSQLRQQTLPPREILVIDQSSAPRRDMALQTDFADLPLRVVYRDTPGQCSSRNAGLAAASTDHILLLDDDVEVPPQLIEAHWRNLENHAATVSCGVAEEIGGGPLQESGRCSRISDVFPAGNTMLVRAALQKSGLFDLAYEKGSRADGDLGMRLYLGGELMMLNSGIRILHHHAPTGGLRKHGARRVTRSSSRLRLLQWNLPSVTEIYLAQRYFTPDQVRAMLWLRALGTFSINGSCLRKTLKVLLGVLVLPCTVYLIRQRGAVARRLFRVFPRIPVLPPRCGKDPPDFEYLSSNMAPPKAQPVGAN